MELGCWGYAVYLKDEKPVLHCRDLEKAMPVEEPDIVKGEGFFTVEALKKMADLEKTPLFSSSKGSFKLHTPTTYRLWRQQIKLWLNTQRRRELAIDIIKRAAENKAKVVEALGGEQLKEYATLILEMAEQPPQTGDLLRWEAEITQLYYQALKLIIPPHYNFTARTRRPPRDPVSAALSYGNMILYRVCEKLLAAHGLDPRIGVLHHPFRNRPSLALDLAEEYKQPIVDTAILPLFTTNTLKPKTHYIITPTATTLSSKGKYLVAKNLYYRLYAEKPPAHQQIAAKIRDLSQSIVGKG